MPGRLRKARWLCVCGLCCWGGWLWLGASGLALLGLFCLLERPWHRVAFVLPLGAEQLEVVRMEAVRLVLDVDGERVEVYRDELTVEGWCELRRAACNRREQAAGRSWLSWRRAAARRGGRRSPER